jgi:hypothetical protein
MSKNPSRRRHGDKVKDSDVLFCVHCGKYAILHDSRVGYKEQELRCSSCQHVMTLEEYYNQTVHTGI